MFRVSVDLSEFRRARAETSRELGRQVLRATVKAAQEGAAEARSAGTFKDRSGNLRRSIQAKTDRSTQIESNAWIIADARYASFVEGGTAPHIIRPKASSGFIGPVRAGQGRRARNDIGTTRVALRWYVGGQPVFARLVHHPGSRAYPFMSHAYLKAERVLYRELERGFQTVQRIWA